MTVTQSLLRHLPAIDRLNNHSLWGAKGWPEQTRTQICRDTLAEIRAQVQSGSLKDIDSVQAAVQALLKRNIEMLARPSLRRVLNGTGVLIHTNAGRAPLSAQALEQIRLTSGGYCNLELSLESGQRGSRHDHIRDLARWLFEADDALAVSNGAGALMLALHGLGRGGRAVISRGELVEIGGSFRVPEVMQAAGVTLVEVGTTNRTWIKDYDVESAALILQVHRSNFRQQGFVHSVQIAELAELATAKGVPLIVDLGSGVVEDLQQWRLQPEPTVRETLKAGADLVTFSGDKLLGGPQAGLIVGRSDLVEKIRSVAMARALRVDSLILAALAATLRSHLSGEATRELPLWQGIDLSDSALQAIGQRCVDKLTKLLSKDWSLRVEPSECAIGGGAQPGATLPSRALCVEHATMGADALSRTLRKGAISVLSRPRDRAVWIDLRSLWTGGADEAIVDLIHALVSVDEQLD
ncbi:MAG: L-seryl-tRNA(Sec) selenium transferase [Myxococcales bacterium]|nr:L-seryl-tRNA(Sec) selenium transferase [Myxococcales bacterium]